MEMLNKVQLKGFVGNVRTYPIGNTSAVRFSVATDYSFVSRDGTPVIETTWHNCIAFSDTISDAGKLKKADNVDLSGRIRVQRYTDANGNDKTAYEIVVNYLKIIG